MVTKEQLAAIRRAGSFTDGEIADALLPALKQGIDRLVSLYEAIDVPQPLKKDVANYEKAAVRRGLGGRRAVSDELYVLYLFLFAALLERERFGIAQYDDMFVVSPETLASVWDSDESLNGRSNRLVFASVARYNDRSQLTVVPIFNKAKDKMLLSFVME